MASSQNMLSIQKVHCKKYHASLHCSLSDFQHQAKKNRQSLYPELGRDSHWTHHYKLQGRK